MTRRRRIGHAPVLPLTARAGGHFLAPKTSSSEHLNRSKICWSLPRVMDCSQFSSLNSIEGENPVFFENAAKDISPRCFLRKAASFLSSGDGLDTPQI